MNSISRLITTALAALCLVHALAAAPQALGPVGNHEMAYDSARQVTVLFGGEDNAGFLTDTWEWDGMSWALVARGGPPARSEASMAYDDRRGVTVLFGGYGGGAQFGDTWEWDGTSWTQVATTGPSPVRSHAMAYDSKRGVVVLHGGYNSPTTTWEWDGASWTQVSTSGPKLWNHSMAYDSQRGMVVLFGGHQEGCCDRGYTYVWDGTSWTRVSTSGPSPRRDCAMAYDSDRDVVVLFGGYKNLADTWEWNGTAWSQVTVNGPTGRQSSAMVYDKARKECVLFGGRSSGALGDTWTFDGTEWRQKPRYQVSPVNGNLYALTPSMEWPDAEALAVQEGGHLATVRSQAEQDWLWKTFGGADLWIGFNDLAVEGQWVWSSGESVSYTNWAPGQPDNQLNLQHTAKLWNSKGGQWDDDNPGVKSGIIELSRIHILAESTKVGTGCIATGTPPILFVDPPVHGKDCRLLVGSLLPNTAGVILLGIQHKGIPLSPKCTAYFDITLPTVPIFFSTNAVGFWGAPPIAVGASQSLNGVELALQAALANLPTAPFGMALSNGVWVTIGY